MVERVAGYKLVTGNRKQKTKNFKHLNFYF